MGRHKRQIIAYAIAVISFLIAGLLAEWLDSNSQLSGLLIGILSIVIFAIPVTVAILWVRSE